MKLDNKNYNADGENRPSQDGKAGETNENFSTGCSNNIIDTDESPVGPTSWS